MKLLTGALIVAGVAVAGTAAGWWTGASNARADERRKQGEVLVASNRIWIARIDSVRQVARTAQLEAEAASKAADVIRKTRREVPTPPRDAPAQVLVAYWEGQAVSAETEANKLRVAYAKEKEATAALTFSRDSLQDKLKTTTHALGSSLDREKGHGKILGFIPKPPKILAAAVGCALGAVIDKGDAARGCGIGSTITVVVAPTR